MLRKILGISIVLIAFFLLFLGLRRVWISGGVFGNPSESQEDRTPLIIDQPDTITTTGLILGQTGNTQGIGTEKHQSASSLSIAMPGWMYNEIRQIFFARMEKELVIDIEFLHPGTLAEYKEILANNKDIDLSLVPSNRLGSLAENTARVRLPDDMYGSLRAEWQELIQSPQGTFFPYLLDPPVIFSRASLANNSWGELLNQSLRNTQHTSFPLVRGRDDITQALWHKGGEILPGHLLLRSLVIESMNDHVDPNNWSSFVSLIQKNISWNTLRLRSWSTNQEDPYCIDYLVGCLFNANETSYSLGFLSDLIAWKRYYPHYQWNALNISPLPLTIGNYKARGWGWIIHQDSAHHKELLSLMQSYMVGAATQEYTFWSDTSLSPFISWDAAQWKRPFFTNLAPYRHRLELITGTWDDSRAILNDEKLIKVLKGEYDPVLYLQ